MSTYTATPSTIKRDWYILDVKDKLLGRVAAEVARRLRGKHKPEYTPHMDTGDYIVLINADKIRVTGNKLEDKMYHHHTGFPGGIKSKNLRGMLDSHPERVLEKAIKGMMPKGPLARQMLSKLKIYAGEEHKHHAQQPQVLEIEG